LRAYVVIGLLPAVMLGIATDVRANPAALVPGGLDSPLPNVSQSRVDGIVGIDYDYEQDSSTIWREQVGNPATDPNAPLPQQRDLAFHQYRHTLTPRLAFGIYHDTFVTAALPIVIAQARELRLDQGVDRAGSSTLIDGLLPPAGFDARDPTAPPPGNLVFRGVNRHGLDQIHLGLGVAVMNQARDDTKPTWKVGAEFRLAIGSVMKFDPTAPSSNTSVGEGVHELKLWTSFDRRLGWVEPWMELFWQVPLTATTSSLFQDPRFGSTNWQLGQKAGVSFGFEAYAVDHAADHNRISLDLGTKVIAHFEGRDYSEMWEVFAFAGDSRGSGPLILDADPTKMGTQPISYPGISNIENYLETAAKIAVRAEIGPHVRFSAGADIVWKTDHVITFADAGVDLPTCGAGVTTHCETDANDLVNPGTEEVNPLHVSRIDLVGHRYHSEDNFGVVIGVTGQVLF
jgi:hypothetical protein